MDKFYDIKKIQNQSLYIPKEFIEEYANYEKQEKQAKAKKDEMRKQIKKAMEETNTKLIDTELIRILYTESGETEAFDEKRFKAEHEDLYNEYCILKPTSSKITITIRETKENGK